MIEVDDDNDEIINGVPNPNPTPRVPKPFPRPQPVSFRLYDLNGNPMPAGTVITATVSSGVNVKVYGSPVVNTLGLNAAGVKDMTTLGTLVVVDVSPPDSCDGKKSALLRLSVTTPLGLTTVLYSIPITY
jgi:hypothetical protein